MISTMTQATDYAHCSVHIWLFGRMCMASGPDFVDMPAAKKRVQADAQELSAIET